MKAAELIGRVRRPGRSAIQQLPNALRNCKTPENQKISSGISICTFSLLFACRLSQNASSVYSTSIQCSGPDARSEKSLDFIGGAERDRTVDLLNAIQALSQTELQPHRREP